MNCGIRPPENFNGSTVLFTTHIQHYIRKTNIKKKKRWREQDLQPEGVRLTILHPCVRMS